MRIRTICAALTGAALITTAAAVTLPAAADDATFDSWIESDDPAPFDTVGGLVFYKAASISFGQKAEGGGLKDLTPLAELDKLAYTVDQSTGYAPSYQIGVVNRTTGVTYARLVWEPYLQTPAQGPDDGEFSELEDGVWWANRVFTNGKGDSPFGNGEGSQSDPQPLSFFADHFGEDTKVAFFGVKQGTTSEITSTVSALTFEGTAVPLGEVDPTRYDADDLAAATAPLQKQVDDLTVDKKILAADKDALTAELAAYKASHPLTPAEARVGWVDSAIAAKAKWGLTERTKLTSAENALRRSQARDITISGTVKVGKKLTAKHPEFSGGTHSYRWYVDGKAVKNATKQTFTPSRSQAGKSLSVKVTTKWTDASGTKHSASYTAKYLRKAYISR